MLYRHSYAIQSFIQHKTQEYREKENQLHQGDNEEDFWPALGEVQPCF